MCNFHIPAALSSGFLLPVQPSRADFASPSALTDGELLPLQHCEAECCSNCSTSQPTDDSGICSKKAESVALGAALLQRVLQWKQKSAGECCLRVHQPKATQGLYFFSPSKLQHPITKSETNI